MQCYLVVFSASIVASINSCEFGNDAIQVLYDRAQGFRKTKSFNTTNQLGQYYQYSYSDDSIDPQYKEFHMTINDESLYEYHKINAANEIEMRVIIYIPDSGYDILRLNRERDGNFTFSWNLNVIAIRSLNAELPNNVKEEYKQGFLALKMMRQKMWDFQKDLSKDEFERVEYFDYVLFDDGAYSIIYKENDGGSINFYSWKKHGQETIFGRMSCNNRKQKYKVVDGKVAVDVEPVSPVNYFNNNFN